MRSTGPRADGKALHGRRPVIRVALAAGLAGLVLAGMPTSASDRGTASAATARTVTLANSWRDWRPVVTPRAGARVGLVSSRRLVIRLRPGNGPGRSAAFRLVLPQAAPGNLLRFRVSYATRGARAYIAVGPGARRVWIRGPHAAATRRVGIVSLRGVRQVRFGLVEGPMRRTRAMGTASLVVHAYSVSVPGHRVALPGDARPTASVAVSSIPSPLPTTGKSPRPGAAPPPAPPPYTGPTVYWGARIGGNAFGAGYEDVPWDARTLARFESEAGKRPSIIAWGHPWFINGVPEPFRPILMNAVRANGSIPLLDWSAWDLANGASPVQPAYQLQDIVNGDYDGYIRQFASDAADWGHPFFVRLYHEMNGEWYPWSERTNGNAPGEFVAAWRHIVDIFRQEGAHNVTWVWSPNEIEGYRGIAMETLYPGDAYVGWLGMSGYNWGTHTTGSAWRTFTNTFRKTYARVRAVAPSKPLMITEFASGEAGGSKAAWIRDAFDVQLPTNFPGVKAVVWWNRREENQPWPIQSSPAATEAFARSISSPYYLSNTFGGITASPIPAP